MKERVVFNDRVYVRDVDSKYPHKRNYFYRKRYDSRTQKYVKESLHRVKWEFRHGPIPWDCVIHHRDGNALNNEYSNLECIPAYLHLRNCHSSRAPRKAAEAVIK